MTKTIEEEIQEAIAQSDTEEVVETPDVVEEAPAQDTPVEPADDAEAEPVPAAVVKNDAPVSLSGSIKAKWNELPEDVRAEWKKREDDIHRMMTSKEGELNLGRTIKEIASPYEAVIRSEGGTVESAFRELLNVSYVLRAGTPQQKANVLLQAAQKFGVDLGAHVGGQHQQDPLHAMQQQIQFLQNQVNPERIKNELQEKFDRDRMNDEIQAFAANPENVHFDAVKTTMGSLIATGRAKNLREAYEAAIWSEPSIRADLLKAQLAQAAIIRKAEMAEKKKAAASVIGSPGLASPSANAPQTSIEDDLAEQFRVASGKI